MRARTSRISRAKDRVMLWHGLLPKEAQDDALSAFEHFFTIVENEIEEAFGDGYRDALDRIKCRKYLEAKDTPHGT
jgi:hypothetical protein